MAQYTRENPIVAPHSGAELAADLNEVIATLLSGQIGETRPSGMAQGGIWARKIGASAIIDIMLFDGNNDVTLLTVDSSTSLLKGNAVFEQEVYDTSGSFTWTKPTGYSDFTPVNIFIWGAGAGGARQDSSQGVAAGGGGGGFLHMRTQLRYLSATETVVVGAGGATRTSDGSGNDGGLSSFAGIEVGGGQGGGQAASTSEGGTASAGLGGFSPASLPPFLSLVANEQGAASLEIGETTSAGDMNGQDAVMAGASGAGVKFASTDRQGTGGASQFGGDGGDSALSGNAADGGFPGGGGGAATNGNSGAGGDGRIEVIVG